MAQEGSAAKAITKNPLLGRSFEQRLGQAPRRPPEQASTVGEYARTDTTTVGGDGSSRAIGFWLKASDRRDMSLPPSGWGWIPQGSPPVGLTPTLEQGIWPASSLAVNPPQLPPRCHAMEDARRNDAVWSPEWEIGGGGMNGGGR